MQFVPFDLEYTQSVWEQQVDINLTESGVHPISLEHLLDGDDALASRLMQTELNYPHVNGIPELRDRIASLYDGASRENVLVTVGAAEANNLIMNTVLEPGDCLLTQTPTYKQVWGLAVNRGHEVRSFRLQSEMGWALDVDELHDKLDEKTRVIAVVNPNNPTGYILTESEMDTVVSAAGKVGAWILADEVYRGAERERVDLADETAPDQADPHSCHQRPPVNQAPDRSWIRRRALAVARCAWRRYGPPRYAHEGVGRR